MRASLPQPPAADSASHASWRDGDSGATAHAGQGLKEGQGVSCTCHVALGRSASRRWPAVAAAAPRAPRSPAAARRISAHSVWWRAGPRAAKSPREGGASAGAEGLARAAARSVWRRALQVWQTACGSLHAHGPQADGWWARRARSRAPRAANSPSGRAQTRRCSWPRSSRARSRGAWSASTSQAASCKWSSRRMCCSRTRGRRLRM
jgi:hypothetical protein